MFTKLQQCHKTFLYKYRFEIIWIKLKIEENNQQKDEEVVIKIIWRMGITVFKKKKRNQ